MHPACGVVLCVLCAYLRMCYIHVQRYIRRILMSEGPSVLEDALKVCVDQCRSHPIPDCCIENVRRLVRCTS